MEEFTETSQSNAPQNLCQMIRELQKDVALRNDHVRFGWLLNRVGKRVYVAVLFLPALMAASPLTMIPGISFIFAFITTLIVLQMLVHRKEVWLPKRLRQVYFKKKTIVKALARMENPAVRLDKHFKPRLMFMTDAIFGQKFVLSVVLVLAILSGPATFVPFVNLMLCIAILILSMGLLTRDGILVLLGYVITLPPLYLLFDFALKNLAA